MLDSASLLSVVDNSLDCIVIADFILSADDTVPSDFRVSYINSALNNILSSGSIKLSVGELFSKSYFASSSVRWLEMARTVFLSNEPCNAVINSDRLSCYFSLKMFRINDKQFCICLTDTTKVQQSEARLEFLAYNDSQTGLPNKNKLMSDLDEFLETVALEDTCLGAMFISFDNLKKICDTRGHSTGDDLIVKAAERLSRFNQSKLPCYRFSSDIFLCLARDISGYDEMLNISDSVLETLQEPYVLGRNVFEVTFSAGIAMFPYDAQNGTDLLKYADNALSHAQRSGKTSVTFFQHVMHEKLIKRMLMEKRLTHAVANNDFEVYFQPQFSSLNGELRGFEALTRWTDSVIGKISPDVFIPVAEETGEIVQLGEWVLRTACKTCKGWIDNYGFTGTISVNVSPVQLKSDTFLDTLKSILVETEYPVSQLEVEITEGAFIDDFSDAIAKLEFIKAMGIKIALDDFGTGYSSLSYLQQLPLTTLKLDKSFVFNIQNDNDNALEEKIADAIIGLASKLGLHTIAEGVETPFQHDFLTKINCDLIQGFLTGKPMPVTDCEDLLKDLQKSESRA